MFKPELVLSNTTSFFIGGLKAAFVNAKRYGFKYLEIIPYRGSTSGEILNWQKIYGIRVVGVHLPNTSWQATWLEEIKNTTSLWTKFWYPVFHAYLNNASQNPGLDIISALETRPYLVIHSDIADQMGDKFQKISKNFHVVVENIPGDIKLFPGGVFDHGHFNETRQELAELNLSELYRKSRPEIIHISYNSLFNHLLPNRQEQEELKQLLKIHTPKYIVIETNPLVSIKKGKHMLEKIINEALG